MKPPTFWIWFFRGANASRSGIFHIIVSWANLWCALAAACLGYLTRDSDPQKLAEIATFPLVASTIGVAFSGSVFCLSNMHTNKSIRMLILRGKKGIEYYVFSFQSAMLILLSIIVYCILVRMGVFTSALCFADDFVRFFLFFLLGVAIVQFWRIVNFSAALTHLQFLLWMHKNEKKKQDGNPAKSAD